MYRTICVEFWTDRKVRSLSLEAKAIFLYLITNPHTHVAGIYYLPFPTIEHETTTKGTKLVGIMKQLCESGLVQWDEEREIIWVVNMLRFQGQGQKVSQGVAYQLKSLHDSPLIEAFLKCYPQIPYEYPMDTVAIGVRPFTSPVPVPSPVPKGGTGGKEKPKGLVEFPKDWDLSLEQRQQAELLGLNPMPEFARFRDYHLAKGTRFRDWPAAWRNWTRKAVEIKEKGPSR